MGHRQSEVLVGDTRGLGPRIVSSNLAALTMSHKHTPETKAKISKTISKVLEEHRRTIPYERLTKTQRKKILLEECGHKCTKCGQGEVWNGERLVLQMEHKDGNEKNTTRENETILCPNCHSQTPTYCRLDDEEKNRHQRVVRKAMKEYGTERRREAQQKSPWKGIKYS